MIGEAMQGVFIVLMVLVGLGLICIISAGILGEEEEDDDYWDRDS